MKNFESLNYDVVTLGRAGVDLYGQQVGGRLEEMASFAKYLGGCPANIAVGTAKLGLRSSIVTRVGNDHLGRFLQEEFAANGVSLEGIKTDPDRLTALVVLGVRDRETFPLIFYRENCADMALSPSDIDEALIASSLSLLVTGTHLSVQGVFDASMRAIEIAKKHDRKVLFDIDYRPVLWGLTSPDAGENRFVADGKVTERLQEVVGHCDLIVGTEEEFHILTGSTDTVSGLRALRDKSSAELVCKLGSEGCVVFKDEIPASLSEGVRGQGFEVDVFNVLGAGDAFFSGYLSGWLRGMPTEECCRRANACGAIVVSRHGCAPAMPTDEELSYFLGNGNDYQKCLVDGSLDLIHWSTTRKKPQYSLYAFAIDHRSQMEEMAADCGAGDEEIHRAKELAFSAFQQVAKDRPEYGMLLDQRFGEGPLHAMSDHDYWIGRPIELPGSRPLEFESDADVGAEIATWPRNHTIKCLLFYHPDDPGSLKKEQEEQVLRLFDACRKNGRELLLEIIASKNGKVESDTVSNIIHRFYDIGVYPDWWKLEPASDDVEWSAICDAVKANDPWCRGIVILGLSKPCEELASSFDCATRFPLVKGFAVGRSIFDQPLREWMQNNISDDEAINQMASNFSTLVNSWERAKLRYQSFSESAAG